MKTYRIVLVMIIAALPFLAGCPERKSVTTKVNKDGSCVRTIGEFDLKKFQGIDSLVDDIPIPIDRSWELENINDSTAVLTKEFESVSDLNALYSSDESELKGYKRKVELKKKFRWFHTVLQYSETYEGLLTEIPLTNYMSEMEAESFKMGDSKNHPLFANLEPKSRKSLVDNIEERFEYWLHDNIYSMAFDDIIEIADSMQLMEKLHINVGEVKDTVKHQIEEADKHMITFSSEDEIDMVELAELMGKEIGLDSIALMELSKIVSEAKLDEKYENEIFFGIMKDYDNKVIMPGLLIDTNAEFVNCDTLIWDVELIKYLDSDFVMFAESKVTNFWAYILSGFIILIAVLIPFLGKLRKAQASEL